MPKKLGEGSTKCPLKWALRPFEGDDQRCFSSRSIYIANDGRSARTGKAVKDTARGYIALPRYAWYLENCWQRGGASLNNPLP